MDVENATGEVLHEPGRKQAHVPGQADQVNLVLFEGRDHFAIVIFSGLALGGNQNRREPQAACGFQASGVSFVGDDDGNPRIGDLPGRDVLGDGLEIRSAPRKQDAEVLHVGCKKSIPNP